MAIRDYFGKAELLESMSWMAMRDDIRVRRLANIYLTREEAIRYEAHRYDGPSPSIVKLFIKSYYQPPRGHITPVAQAVIAEIERQRKIRDARARNRPFPRHQEKKESVFTRLGAISTRRYRILTAGWKGEPRLRDNCCRAIGRVNGVVMMVDDGGYDTLPRIYMRHLESGEVKVVVLKKKYSGDDHITKSLLSMVPKTCHREMFSGRSMEFDFHREGFRIDGEYVPWDNVRRVYRGKDEALRTMAQPKKET